MTQLVQSQSSPAAMQQIESVLIKGDLATLSPEQRLHYYKSVCDSVGLNPLTKPFDYIQLNGKLVLYAKKDATEQLRKIHGVSIESIEGKEMNGVYVVTAKAKDSSGRSDASTGAVTIQNLKGDAFANAIMKAETKAKRRVTLSICGLGLLDETELETIPTPRPGQILPAQPEPGDGNTEPLGYRIGFGQWKNRSLEEIYRNHGPEKMRDYIAYLESAALKKGVEVTGAALEFITEAERFLGAMENAPMDVEEGGIEGQPVAEEGMFQP